MQVRLCLVVLAALAVVAAGQEQQPPSLDEFKELLGKAVSQWNLAPVELQEKMKTMILEFSRGQDIPMSDILSQQQYEVVFGLDAPPINEIVNSKERGEDEIVVDEDESEDEDDREEWKRKVREHLEKHRPQALKKVWHGGVLWRSNITGPLRSMQQ
eukprot:TRINITY_DN5839_c0_g1_i1.p2 TRINITY_DN5839_c0_g1~~TRINITY_DN5839_c0_g1_i1.p2  ORF type:complete len:157 (+),score=52.38 TRINITY_DN5839_c0_g1_i1:51-521(+)